MLQQIAMYAQQHDVPIISPATRTFLVKHLNDQQPTHCCEVGTAIGYSSQLISQTVAARDGQLTSFEISHPSYMLACWHKRQAKQFNTTYYHANVLHVPLDRLWQQQLDFVFIDGMKSEYTDYLRKLLPHCAPSSAIILDDVITYRDKMNSLFHYLDEQELDYQVISLTDGDGVACIHVA